MLHNQAEKIAVGLIKLNYSCLARFPESKSLLSLYSNLQMTEPSFSHLRCMFKAHAEEEEEEEEEEEKKEEEERQEKTK